MKKGKPCKNIGKPIVKVWNLKISRDLLRAEEEEKEKEEIMAYRRPGDEAYE
jgi:hypothetical protein